MLTGMTETVPTATPDVVDLLRHALDTRPEAIREALTLRPCHITGMHRPEHHLDFTCEHQKTRMLDNLLGVLGIQDPGALPHALDDDSCSWCHRVPSQEMYRDRLRRTWAWAGVPLSDELAAPANDAPRPADAPAVLAAFGYLHEQAEDPTDPSTHDGWFLRTDVHHALTAMGVDDIGYERIALAEQNLVVSGYLKEKPTGLIRGSRLTTAGMAAATAASPDSNPPSI